MTDHPLVDIRDATIYRGDTRVFLNLSLQISQRQQVAILGPNGCGKTTLLRVLNREIYPVVKDRTWVKILGRDNWNVWDLRRKIGIVSNELQMRYAKHNTGIEVVLSGFFSSVGIHGRISRLIETSHRKAALRAMHELSITHLADRRLGDMSTGQQRRCLIARALAHEPDTLILDEPTAGLDLTSSFDLLSRLRRLIDSGKTVVMVTHQLGDIPPEIQRVILIRAGEIVADGNKSDVLTEQNLSHTYATNVRLTEVDGHYLVSPAHA